MQKKLTIRLASALLFSFALSCNGFAKTQTTTNTSTHGEPTLHEVGATVLFNEISDISISNGHFRVSVELMMTWKADTSEFLTEFGDEIIHGDKLEEFLKTHWHPEFFVANAENPRTPHYRTLDVLNGQFELFERFEVELSIDADMPRYPFGELDLYMEIAAFSGDTRHMRWTPEEIIIGHHDAHHYVVKGNWEVSTTSLEETQRKSLNHGGREKFSYLISHVKVTHNPSTATQKVLFPLLSIIVLTLLFNHFMTSQLANSAQEREIHPFADLKVGGQLTLFLTVPALKFALAEDVPSTHYLNLTDGLFVLASMLVTFNLLISVATHYLADDGTSDRSKKVEKAAKLLSPIFAISFFIFIWFATSKMPVH